MPFTSGAKTFASTCLCGLMERAGCGAEGPFPTRALPERPYLEPHHTDRLSDGGPDHPARVIALCQIVTDACITALTAPSTTRD